MLCLKVYVIAPVEVDAWKEVVRDSINLEGHATSEK